MRTILGITVMSALVVFKAGSATGVEPGHDGKPVTIVAFGDSTTAPRGSLRTYADCLRSDLPGKGLAVEVVFNAGVGGNSTEGAKARFAKDVLDRHPDIAVIQFGINDSTVNVWAKPPATQAPVTPDQYAANLTCFIEALRKQNCAVILMTPNPMRWTPALTNLYGKPPYRPADPDGLNETLRPYAERVRAVARTNNVPVVDVYKAFQEYGKVKGQSTDDLLLDGMHPNDKGHRLVADLLIDEIMITKVIQMKLLSGTRASDADVMRLKLLPPGPDNPRNDAGAFIQLKDGRILFVYTHFIGTSGDDAAPAYLAGRYSSDGGRTWTTNDVMIVSGDEALWHQVMSASLLRLQDGRIALFYLRLNSMLDERPIMRVSTDEAKTWSEPKVCISDADVGYYVLNNDRVIQLKSGRLVMPLARHDDLTKPDKFNHSPRTSCWLSDDNGATWHQSKTVLTGKHGPHDPAIRTFDGGPIREVALQEPGVVELKDGRLMMFCRTHVGYAFISFSGDQGETWSLDVPMPGILAALSAPAIKRIPKTGDLLMVWDDLSMGVPNWSPGKRTPYTVAISRDDGMTWDKRKNIEVDLDGWYCYTAVEFVGDCVLLAHHSDKRDMTKNLSGLQTTQITRFSVDWLYALQ